MQLRMQRMQLSSQLNRDGNGGEGVRQSIRSHYNNPNRFHTGLLVILEVVRSAVSESRDRFI